MSAGFGLAPVYIESSKTTKKSLNSEHVYSGNSELKKFVWSLNERAFVGTRIVSVNMTGSIALLPLGGSQPGAFGSRFTPSGWGLGVRGLPPGPYRIMVFGWVTAMGGFGVVRSVDITGLVLTKLDGTAKGGVVIAIANSLALPVRYIGVGERIDDLQPFDTKEFATALFSFEETTEG